MPSVHVHYPFDDRWLRRRRKDENGGDDGEGVLHLSTPKAAMTKKTKKKEILIGRSFTFVQTRGSNDNED